MTNIALVGEIVDRDAVEIGRLYEKAKGSAIDTANHLIGVGTKLFFKKNEVGHGNWLPWLAKNEGTLGFGWTQAKRILGLVNSPLAGSLEEAAAILKIAYGKTTERGDGELIQQSLSNEHYTPAQYIQAARAVLGAIDLDPASCEEANKIVGAVKFFDEKNDGLGQRWEGRVWLNPPYGDLVGSFVGKLTGEMAANRVSAAVVLVNAHCTDTKWFQPLWDGCLCFTNHRVNFYGDDERSGSTHGSVFVYFGPEREKFMKHFSQFGAVVARVS